MPTPSAQYGQFTLHDIQIASSTMPLKCAECGKIDEYEVGKIIVDPDFLRSLPRDAPMESMLSLPSIRWEEWITFSGYFVCSHCESGGPWKFTRDAQKRMAFKILRHTLDPASSDIIISKMTMFDGTEPRTCYEGVAHLKGLIAGDPNNSYLWNRLGNLLYGADQNDLALPAFQKAHELEPRCVETLHSLADYWFYENRYVQAAQYFHQVLRLCRTGIWRNERLKEKIVQHTIEMLMTIQFQTRGRINAFPPFGSVGPMSEAGGSDAMDMRVFKLDNEADLLALARFFLHEAVIDQQSAHSQWESKRRRTPSPALKQRPKPAARQPDDNARCRCGSGRKYKNCCKTRG